MALEVARIVQDWLHDDAVKWEATPDVVDWARPYGTDLERAWAECPRADFLMAIAGACQADAKTVVRLACSVAREALVFVPAKLAPPRKAIHIAETHRLGDRLGEGIPGAMPVSDATMALVEKRIAEAQRLEKAALAAVPIAVDALGTVVTRFLLDPITRHRFTGAGDLDPAKLTPDMTAWSAALLEQALKEKAVTAWQSRTAACYQAVASAHGVRAAASVLTVASSANAAFQSKVLIGSLARHEGAATDETLATIDEAAGIARRSGARVYSEAALVFVHAAGAFGQAEAAGERAWVSAVAKTLTAMLYAAGGAEPNPEDGGPISTTLGRYAEKVKAAKLAEYAERVRAAIPLSALKPPMDEADRNAALQHDPIGALRNSVASLAPLARLLGDADAADALETATAILNATGPVRKKELAQALRTVHERMAAMFRRRAGEVTGAAHDEAAVGMASARQAMREMDEALSRLGVEKPS